MGRTDRDLARGGWNQTFAVGHKHSFWPTAALRRTAKGRQPPLVTGSSRPETACGGRQKSAKSGRSALHQRPIAGSERRYAKHMKRGAEGSFKMEPQSCLWLFQKRQNDPKIYSYQGIDICLAIDFRANLPDKSKNLRSQAHESRRAAGPAGFL